MTRLIKRAIMFFMFLGLASVPAYAMTVSGDSASFEGTLSFTQPVKGQWSQENGHWHYTDQNGPVRGRWICILSSEGQKEWYCFDIAGNMCTGWQKSGSGNWYYLREKQDERMGAMEHGFLLDPTDGRVYYLDPDTGIMKTGWMRIEGRYYYFAQSSDAGASWNWNRSLQKWVCNDLGKRPCGSMYVNEYTPDGNRVDERGVCTTKE